jgi:nucleoid-associated protein YgaU
MKPRLLVRAVTGALVSVFLMLTSALRAAAAPAAPAAPAVSETPPAASAPAEDRTVALEKELATVNADKTKLSEEVASAWKETDSAKAAGEALGQERDKLAAAVKQLTDENAALNRQLADRGDAAKRLAAVTSRFEDARKELLVLKNNNAELNDNLRTTIKERDRLSRAVRSEQSTRQLEEAQATIARLQRENADLQSEHAALTTRPSQAAATTAASTASATTGSADEVARLKDELGKANFKVDVTVRAFALAQQENEQLKKQIEQSTGERTTSGAQAQDARKRAALRTQLAGATSSGEGTGTEVTRLNSELAAARDAAENASLRESLRQTQNTGAGVAAENARLRTALAVAGRAPAAATSQPTRPAPVAVAASAPAMPAPAAPPPAPRTYRVASGDTLSRISSRYYGTAARWQDIYNANRDQLRSPDVLPLGVELKIP